MTLFWSELSYVEDFRSPVLFACFVKGDCADDLVDCDWREDDRDRGWFFPFGADRTPESADVRGGPGAVGHDQIHRAADIAIQVRE